MLNFCRLCAEYITDRLLNKQAQVPLCELISFAVNLSMCIYVNTHKNKLVLRAESRSCLYLGDVETFGIVSAKLTEVLSKLHRISMSKFFLLGKKIILGLFKQNKIKQTSSTISCNGFDHSNLNNFSNFLSIFCCIDDALLLISNFPPENCLLSFYSFVIHEYC